MVMVPDIARLRGASVVEIWRRRNAEVEIRGNGRCDPLIAIEQHRAFRSAVQLELAVEWWWTVQSDGAVRATDRPGYKARDITAIAAVGRAVEAAMDAQQPTAQIDTTNLPMARRSAIAVIASPARSSR